MVSDPTHKKLALAVAKMPKWLRHDLASTDPALRERAEESLLAMILAAIDDEAAGEDGAAG